MKLDEIENRLSDLEARLAFQDDTIQTLSDQIARQEMDIRELRETKHRLMAQIKEMAPSNIRSQEEEEPPPHY